ncbi:unnamed protein product [Ixodes pacificus]
MAVLPTWLAARAPRISLPGKNARQEKQNAASFVELYSSQQNFLNQCRKKLCFRLLAPALAQLLRQRWN